MYFSLGLVLNYYSVNCGKVTSEMVRFNLVNLAVMEETAFRTSNTQNIRSDNALYGFLWGGYIN